MEWNTLVLSDKGIKIQINNIQNRSLANYKTICRDEHSSKDRASNRDVTCDVSLAV